MTERKGDTLFIPETPISSNKDKNCMNTFSLDNKKCEFTYQRDQSGCFVPESQCTPIALNDKKENLVNVENNSSSYNNCSLMTTKTIVKKSEASSDRNLHSTDENTFDDSSFINPTQTISSKNSTNTIPFHDNGQCIEAQKVVLASSDKNASKEIVNETENVQETESLSNSEHNVTLYGDRKCSEDTSTNNIYANETQRISEENYSLFMANTQKITGSLSRNETLPSQLTVPPKLSILLEETQKISSSLKESKIKSSEDNLQKLDESNVKVLSAKEESDDEDFFLPTQLKNVSSRVHPQVYASAEVKTMDNSVSPNEHDETAPIADKVTNITISETPNLQLEDSLGILNTTRSTDLNDADEIDDSFDRKSSCMSENLLAEINSDDERAQEIDTSFKDKKKFSDDEYEEVYEGATQILKSYDERSFTPEKYCPTQHDNEKEDTILSSQESTCFEKSKTDLLIKTMSLTQNVCDVSKECLLETQYDIVDMTLATQSKAQDSKDKKINDSTNDKRPFNEYSKSNNVSILQDSPFDSDEDSIDYLASTQELMDGLVEKERPKEEVFNEIEQAESIFEKENMALQTKCNHDKNTKASKGSSENFTIESSEQEIVEKKNGLKIDIDNKTSNSNFSDENKSYSVQKTKSGSVTQPLNDYRKIDTLFSEGESEVNFEKKKASMDRPIAQSSSKLNSKSTENGENQCQWLPNKKDERKESIVSHEFSRTNDTQPKEIEIENNKCITRRSSRNRATKETQQKVNEASIQNKKSSLPNSNDGSKTRIENSVNNKEHSKSVKSIPRRSLRAKSISSVNEKAIESVKPKKLTKRVRWLSFKLT